MRKDVNIYHHQVHRVDEQADQEVPQASGGQQRQRCHQGAPGQLKEGRYQCFKEMKTEDSFD